MSIISMWTQLSWLKKPEDISWIEKNLAIACVEEIFWYYKTLAEFYSFNLSYKSTSRRFMLTYKILGPVLIFINCVTMFENMWYGSILLHLIIIRLATWNFIYFFSKIYLWGFDGTLYTYNYFIMTDRSYVK